MPATMPRAFSESLRAVCREAASVCSERQDDRDVICGAFTLEDFHAALALELDMPASHLSLAKCRLTLATLPFVERRGKDWWVYRPWKIWPPAWLEK